MLLLVFLRALPAVFVGGLADGGATAAAGAFAVGVAARVVIVGDEVVRLVGPDLLRHLPDDLAVDVRLLGVLEHPGDHLADLLDVLHRQVGHRGGADAQSGRVHRALPVAAGQGVVVDDQSQLAHQAHTGLAVEAELVELDKHQVAVAAGRGGVLAADQRDLAGQQRLGEDALPLQDAVHPRGEVETLRPLQTHGLEQGAVRRALAVRAREVAALDALRPAHGTVARLALDLPTAVVLEGVVHPNDGATVGALHRLVEGEGEAVHPPLRLEVASGEDAHLGGDQAGLVGDVGDEQHAVAEPAGAAVHDLAAGAEVDRVDQRRAIHDDEARLVLPDDGLELVVVHHAGARVDVVAQAVLVLARLRRVRPVRQVATGRQVEGDHGVAFHQHAVPQGAVGVGSAGGANRAPGVTEGQAERLAELLIREDLELADDLGTVVVEEAAVEADLAGDGVAAVAPALVVLVVEQRGESAAHLDEQVGLVALGGDAHDVGLALLEEAVDEAGEDGVFLAETYGQGVQGSLRCSGASSKGGAHRVVSSSTLI